MGIPEMYIIVLEDTESGRRGRNGLRLLQLASIERPAGECPNILDVDRIDRDFIVRAATVRNTLTEMAGYLF